MSPAPFALLAFIAGPPALCVLILYGGFLAQLYREKEWGFLALFFSLGWVAVSVLAVMLVTATGIVEWTPR